MAITNNVYGISLKAAQSTIGPDFLGGILGLIKASTTARIARFTNPSTLVVHANPILGSNCLTITGYTSPPAEFPVEAMPIAKARFFEKYVARIPMHGVK